MFVRWSAKRARIILQRWPGLFRDLPRPSALLSVFCRRWRLAATLRRKDCRWIFTNISPCDRALVSNFSEPSTEFSIHFVLNSCFAQTLILYAIKFNPDACPAVAAASFAGQLRADRLRGTYAEVALKRAGIAFAGIDQHITVFKVHSISFARMRSGLALIRIRLFQNRHHTYRIDR